VTHIYSEANDTSMISYYVVARGLEEGSGERERKHIGTGGTKEKAEYGLCRVAMVAAEV
jgi:hypothetical protein